MSIFGKRKGEGYGNIYTPHAGSMIIQVQREHGLANRTLVLTPAQVQLLKTITSRKALGIVALFAVSWFYLVAVQTREVIEARRAPSGAMERARLDSLERSLTTLQQRYDQVSRMLGASPAAAQNGAVVAAP